MSTTSKNPWSLYSNMDGYLIAEREITSGVNVAVTMGDVDKAFEFMEPILRKHRKFGANDTVVRDAVFSRLEQHYSSTECQRPSPLDLLQNAVAAQVRYWDELKKLEDYLAGLNDEELNDYQTNKLSEWVENLASGVDSPDSVQVITELELGYVVGALRLQMLKPRG